MRGLAHPPAETLHHPKLLRGDEAESLSPELLEGPGAVLGRLDGNGPATPSKASVPLFWPDAYRNRHAYVLGATRMGKSTLLLNLIAQDMNAGRGVCLIDPHGDLAHDVLARVPEERADDALYLDLSDRDFPLALGLLEAADEWEERLVCSDLLSILRRLFAASWGDRLEHILRHALLTLLAQPACRQRTEREDITTECDEVTFSMRRPTLRDVRPLLSHKGYRAALLQQVADPDLLAFWRTEFPAYSSSTLSPVYNKLGLLLSSPLVRNVVAQSQSRLSFSQAMQSRKIVIVNLASGLIGEDNAHFLGALLVSKLQIAAMQSLRHDQAARSDFTLYVDEFQHFVVSSFAKILSEAGKAGLSLVMANQFLEQLPAGLQPAILGNVGTLVSFRVSADSGRLLEKELAGRASQSQLVSLGRGEAVARIGGAKDTAFLRTLLPPREVPGHEARTEEIVERTRRTCCRRREDMEAEQQRERERLESLFAEEPKAPRTKYAKRVTETKEVTEPEADDEEANDLESSSSTAKAAAPKKAQRRTRRASPIKALPEKEKSRMRKRRKASSAPKEGEQRRIEKAEVDDTKDVGPTEIQNDEMTAADAPLLEPESFGWIEEESVEEVSAKDGDNQKEKGI